MKNLDLIREGFWRGGYPDDQTLPDAAAAQDETWTGEERTRVLQHLAEGEVTASYRGMSSCRICGKRNGSQDISDGTFVWPSGFAHYLTDHAVKPSQAFIDHVNATHTQDVPH